MARPRKNNADYFTHDNNMRNDPKIRAIRKSHGMAGYAAWCMLLEVLTGEDDFEYKVDEVSMEIMAGDFDIDVDDLNAIIESFSRLKLIQFDGKTIRCNNLTERMQPLMDKRARKRGWAEQNKDSETVSEGVLDVQNPQRKVNKSKVNKSKEDTANDARGNEDEISELKEEKYPPQIPPPPPPRTGYLFEDWIDSLKTDFRITEGFTITQKIPAEYFEEYVTRFRALANTQPEKYVRRHDLTGHFLNWSRVEYQKEKKSGPAATTNGRATINRLGENPDVYNEKQAF